MLTASSKAELATKLKKHGLRPSKFNLHALEIFERLHGEHRGPFSLSTNELAKELTPGKANSTANAVRLFQRFRKSGLLTLHRPHNVNAHRPASYVYEGAE